MGAVTDSLCDKLYGDLSRESNALRRMAMANRNSMLSMADRLRGLMPSSSFGSIMDQLNSIYGTLPNFGGNLTELLDAINNCMFLGSQIGNPNNALRMALDIINRKIRDQLSGLAGTSGFAKIISDLLRINDRLNGYDLFGMIGSLDSILSCLDGLCGMDVGGYIDDVNYNMDALSLDTVGNFDVYNMISKVQNTEAASQLVTAFDRINEFVI